MGKEPRKKHRLRTFGVTRRAGIGLALTVALGGIGLSLIVPAPDVAGPIYRFWPLAFVGFPILGALVFPSGARTNRTRMGFDQMRDEWKQ